MKAIYASGRTQHIVRPFDERCPHLHNWQVAKLYTAQIVGPIRTLFYCCPDCHEALQNEIAQNFILCNDCQKPVAPEEAVCWSPYDHSPNQPTILLCSDCECGTKHLDRIEQDREDFFATFPAKQRKLRIVSASEGGMNLRYIPPHLKPSSADYHADAS